MGRDGSLWVGTRNGVNRFHGGRITKIAGPWDSKLQPVSSLAEDRHGNVWVGTTGGLVRISGGRVAVHSETEGLSGASVLAVYEDREGSLWVGTEAHGLNQLRDVKIAAGASGRDSATSSSCRSTRTVPGRCGWEATAAAS